MKKIIKNVTALIPARKGSKGIINKNINKLHGKPLLVWTIKAALDSKYINNVIVSTDSKKIADISTRHGAIVPSLRPKKFSKDRSSTESVIKHYLENWSDKDETLVLLQPTSPIRKKETLDKAFKKFYKGKYDSLLSISRVKNHFIWKVKKDIALPQYNINKRLRRQDMDDSNFMYYENGSIYIFNAKKFLKFENRLFGKIGYLVLDKFESMDIDDKDDIKIANSFIKLIK